MSRPQCKYSYHWGLMILGWGGVHKVGGVSHRTRCIIKWKWYSQDQIWAEPKGTTKLHEGVLTTAVLPQIASIVILGEVPYIISKTCGRTYRSRQEVWRFLYHMLTPTRKYPLHESIKCPSRSLLITRQLDISLPSSLVQSTCKWSGHSGWNGGAAWAQLHGLITKVRGSTAASECPTCKQQRPCWGPDLETTRLANLLCWIPSIFEEPAVHPTGYITSLGMVHLTASWTSASTSIQDYWDAWSTDMEFQASHCRAHISEREVQEWFLGCGNHWSHHRLHYPEGTSWNTGMAFK